MSKKISASEHPLSKIFSSDFEYHIPTYQRPYSWGVDQASELFDDLIDFHSNEHEEGYFLGSIVLIKMESDPVSDVIDGQQRLTTLTILLATIASKVPEKDRATILKYIVEPGNKFELLAPSPRLTLREKDREFFESNVQALNFLELKNLEPANLGTESQVNIFENSAYFLSALEKNFGNDTDALGSFVQFLLRRCFLVAVSTPNRKSAFRIFSVMNTRGLELQTTDIIKADLINPERLDANEQKYSDKWEEIEVFLGRGGFNDLFTYIRMIYAKDKSRRSLLEEFRSHVINKVPNAVDLIDDVLSPYADALSIVHNENYQSTENAEDVNRFLKWLNRIDNSDWIPPAILFIKRFGEDADTVLNFLKKLERLAAYLHICRKNINQRIEAYGDILGEIERSSNGIELSTIELEAGEIQEMREALDGNIYELTPRRRNYLILRLDSFIADGAATYDPKILTIEHILPQTVENGSKWDIMWPEQDDRQNWVHRIANLVPLNKRKNSAAQNFDFSRKCDIYFSGSNNISSYALTTQVLGVRSNSGKWNKETLDTRQKMLLEILFENWQLS